MSTIVDTIEAAVEVCEILQQAGHQAVFAGGCVRDFLMEKEPADIDIATSATPDQVQALFPKNVAVGKSFGVIRVIHDEEEFEVATFRTDSKAGDGRRPDSVEFSSMKEDALRRDLTINAIFFDPISDKFYDFVGGQHDIKRKIICMVGEPSERIKEDYLRILRVIRFAARYNWNIAGETELALLALAPQIVLVSRERIGDELTKIITGKQGFVGLMYLKKFGLLRWAMPQATEGSSLRELMPVIIHNNSDKALAWAGVLHTLDWKDIVAHLESLRFDTKTVESVVNIVEICRKLGKFKELTVAERTKLLAHDCFDRALQMFEQRGDEKAVEFIVHFRKSTPLSQVKPERFVNGNDLIALGMKPGKKFKEILQALEDKQRDGSITNRDSAMIMAKQLVSENI